MFAAAVCGIARGDCVIPMRRPFLSLTRPPGYYESRRSRSGNVLLLPEHVPRGPERGTTCDCGAFVHGSLRLGVAFFRLVGLLHFGVGALKSGVLIQNRSWGVANRFGSDDLFVVSFPSGRLTPGAHAFGLRIAPPHSCPCAFSACHGRATLVFPGFSGAGDDGRSPRYSAPASPGRPVPGGQRPSAHGLAARPKRRGPAAESAATEGSPGSPATDSDQRARPAAPAAERSSATPN